MVRRMRRTAFQREIAALHGPNAEIIELDADERPTGRSYRFVKPEAPTIPAWRRLVVGLMALAALPFLVAIIVVCALVAVGGAWLIWAIFTS